MTKKFTFDAERYSTDLEVTIKRGDQVVPQVKLKIGPSIGDQGIKHYTFYSVAPEAIAAVGEKVERHAGCGNQREQQQPGSNEYCRDQWIGPASVIPTSQW